MGFQSKDTSLPDAAELGLIIPLEPEGIKMPYRTNRELPAAIRDRLSEAAQNLYRVAFNSALQWYGEEEKAHHSAWSAVRNQAASLTGEIRLNTLNSSV
ncbi:ChaB family protein [Leptodesmis sichuanensis]|uniref:ChaB family protein n=1 Tax=Leptodesmis sichuanensis TaxID=2906798 RepID=UPI001F46FEA2